VLQAKLSIRYVFRLARVKLCIWHRIVRVSIRSGVDMAVAAH